MLNHATNHIQTVGGNNEKTMRKFKLTFSILIFTFICQNISAQIGRPDFFKKDFSEQWDFNEKRANLNYSMAGHKDLIQIIYNNSIIAESFIQDFIQVKLKFTHSGEMKIKDLGNGLTEVKQKYTPKVQTNGEIGKYLEIISTYYEIDELNRVITTYKIKGHDQYVIDFFVKYYPTTINLESIREKTEITSNYIEDIAIFKILENGKAEIEIKNRKYPDYKNFVKQL